MKKNILTLSATLLSSAYAVGQNSDVINYNIPESNYKLHLKKSTANDPKREFWLESVDGKRELVWSKERVKGMSIATNRFHPPVLTPIEKARKEYSKRIMNIQIPFVGDEPDPYQNMDIVSAQIDDDVLVVILKTKLSSMAKQHLHQPNYKFGYFYDQTIATRNRDGTTNDWLSHFPITSVDHKKGEYFLRSFVKNHEGKWEVHMNAVLTILWANSIHLPIESINIEDQDTYHVTFEGKHDYIIVDTIQEQKEISLQYLAKTKGKNITLAVYDGYGEYERIIIKTGLLPGKTTKTIKYIDNQDDNIFNDIYTSFPGNENLVRVAYDKNTWSKPNSWVGVDELSIRQVDRGIDELPCSYPLFRFVGEVKAEYGYLALGHLKLNKNEVRQTYCGSLEEVLNILEKNRKRNPRSKFNFGADQAEMQIKRVEEEVSKYKAKQNK